MLKSFLPIKIFPGLGFFFFILCFALPLLTYLILPAVVLFETVLVS